jgi:hypothetical protein
VQGNIKEYNRQLILIFYMDNFTLSFVLSDRKPVMKNAIQKKERDY